MLSAEFDWKAADFIQDIQTLLKKVRNVIVLDKTRGKAEQEVKQRLLQLHKSDSGAVFWVGVAAASAQQSVFQLPLTSPCSSLSCFMLS